MHAALDALSALAEAVGRPAPPQQSIVPPVPASLDDVGLPQSFLEQMVLKTLYFRGETMGCDLATSLCLRFSILDSVIEFLRRQRLLEVKHSLGIGNMSSAFALTASGRVLTREYLESNSYVGPVPVPLHQYRRVVTEQRLRDNWLTREALEKAFSHMVVNHRVLSQLGPAVNAGKSFLIYGQPGNGKTFLAEALFHIETAPVFIPYALECQGNIIQVYDPLQHQKIEEPTPSAMAVSEDAAFDSRWFRARRPLIVTGGELTLEMLDLSFNPVTRIYDAPFQLKANNGIYLIDDFGRQRVKPAEVLNRWIVPMERRIDYLSFQTGGKMEMPFEAFLVFSTNLNPDDLGDEAFLRRIHYKMLVQSPDDEEYRQIFRRYCASHNLPVEDGLLTRFLQKHYAETGKPMRRCHPRDIISHAIDLIRFEHLPYALNEELLDAAFENCFVKEVEQ